jgi:hypothetical protein
MFRSRSKLAAGVALIAVLVALYAAEWLFLAHRAEHAIDAYIARQHEQGVNLSVATRAVVGFPTRIEVRLTGIVADGLPHVPNSHLTVPTATAWSRPWHLDAWRFALLGGATLDGPQGHIGFDLLGGHASAVLGPGGTPGGDLADLHIDNIVIASGDRLLKAARAGLTVHLPPTAPRAHEEPLFSATLQARMVTLPSAVAPLGQQIDHLMLDGTWRGPLPPGKLADALAAWRDDGGTIELQSIDLGWGPLALTADGTLALDKDLQPLGAFSARIMGYDAILDALIASGGIKPNDASLARMGLSMMTQRGVDGTPQLKTPVTFQDNSVFLGPARLMKLTKIAW